MDEVFIFEDNFEDTNGRHSVIVSEVQPGNLERLYNCTVDIHTNIQVFFNGTDWVEKDKGKTIFSTFMGKLIQKKIRVF